ncbi:hypothetical protein O6H91_Y510600 [Diphasiastrum complanatum]|nr:hypothetical protein O6H91_Y510600 [Diphasiastrum complanatum]
MAAGSGIHTLRRCNNAFHVSNLWCSYSILQSSVYVCWLEQLRGLQSLSDEQDIVKVEDRPVSRWRQLPPVPPQNGKNHLRAWKGTKNLTALRWVKECCPDLPHSLVQKLFRLRKVRIRLWEPNDVGGPLQSSSIPRVMCVFLSFSKLLYFFVLQTKLCCDTT